MKRTVFQAVVTPYEASQKGRNNFISMIQTSPNQKKKPNLWTCHIYASGISKYIVTFQKLQAKYFQP